MNFEQISKLLGSKVQLKPNRVKSLYGYAVQAAPVDGEFWECGVFTGGSARLLAEVLRDRPRPLRLFDTFTGFLSVSPEDGSYPKVGMFKDTSIDGVREFVAADFAVLYPGLIPTTFAGLESSKIAFAHVDVDLYAPTKAALEFILPRMVEHGIVVIDDYGDPHYPGVATAVDEFHRELEINNFGEYDHQAMICVH